jgi:hypothetical protein
MAYVIKQELVIQYWGHNLGFRLQNVLLASYFDMKICPYPFGPVIILFIKRP